MFGQRLSNGKYKYTVRYTDELTGLIRKITIIRDDDTTETKNDVKRIINEKRNKTEGGNKLCGLKK